MNKITLNNSVKASNEQFQTRANQKFYLYDDVWQLDSNISISVVRVREILDKVTYEGFVKTLGYYARSLSASHTRNIFDRFKSMMLGAEEKKISPLMLINYRATLTRRTEWYLGTIRGFLKKWNKLGYFGVDDDVVDLLEGWRLKGNIKGDAVKRLDPTHGPLTDNELIAFNEAAVYTFEVGECTITDLAVSLLISNTGRRPIQIVNLKVGDLDGSRVNTKGDPMYIVHIPRAKQRGEHFRGQRKSFAMTHELWQILDLQRQNSINIFKKHTVVQLTDKDKNLLPLFPLNNMDIAECSLIELRKLLATDALHLKTNNIKIILEKVVNMGECYSERTGIRATARPFKPALIEPARRTPHAKAIVQQQLHAIAPRVGKQVTVMGLG